MSNFEESFVENLDFEHNSMYDEENTSNGVVSMTSKESLAAALKATHKTHAEAAVSIGWTKQQLSSKLIRNSLRADEFFTLMDAIGVEVTLTVKETGEVIKENIPGYGRRVKMMVDRVSYDTGTSHAISNNFFADGVNEYTDGKALELYIDKNGRYFFAEYTNWEGGKDRINPCSADDAARFISKYGTELHKAPKE